MYRKYPLRASCNLTFTNGRECSQELITSMQISTVYGVHDLYVTKIYVDPSYISVTINNYTDGTVVGCFAGKATQDFQVIPLQSNLSAISGNMTIGTLASLSKLTKGTYHLRDELNNLGSRDNGRIEDSVIFCFTPPGVTKITAKAKSVVGKVTTVKGDNLAITQVGFNEIKLSATNLDSIRSNDDFSGKYGNCNTPVIKRINTVYPDEDGNIDIYGIVPIVIDVVAGELQMDSGLELIDVCPERDKISPPVNISDDYYADILTASFPEWKTWPKFS